jgi:alanine adding enzyme
MTFEELTPEVFEKFALAQGNGSFAQTAEFAFHRSREGARTAFLGVVSDGAPVLAGLVSWQAGELRGADFYGGPIGDFTSQKVVRTFVSGLKKWAGKQKISHVTMSPTEIVRTRTAHGEVLEQNLLAEDNLKLAGLKKTDVEVTPHFIFVKNLAKFTTEAELFKSFSASTKAMINGAARNFIEFKKLTRKELPRLEKLMEDSAERQGFKSRGVYFQESLFDSFADSSNFTVDFAVAEMNIKDLKKFHVKKRRELEKEIEQAESEGLKNELSNRLAAIRARQELLADEKADRVEVAAGVFIKSKRETVYLFAGNDPKYLKFNAIYGMLWEEMRESLKNKVALFNFYGIEGKFDGSDGILNYKKGFNGIVQEYLGQWILVVSPLKYNSVRVLKKLRR